MRKNHSVLLTVVATLVVAMALVNCGGGSSPTEPKPTPGPTPTPVPVIPSVEFISSTPPCGSTIRTSDVPAVVFRIHYTTNTHSVITADLIFANGGNAGLINNGATGTVESGSGFVNLETAMPMLIGQTQTVRIELHSGQATGPLLASTTENCSYTILQ